MLCRSWFRAWQHGQAIAVGPAHRLAHASGAFAHVVETD